MKDLDVVGTQPFSSSLKVLLEVLTVLDVVVSSSLKVALSSCVKILAQEQSKVHMKVLEVRTDSPVSPVVSTFVVAPCGPT